MKRISADHAIYAMQPDNNPFMEIEPGEEIIFETKDCFSNQLQSNSDDFANIGWEMINPATGPVAIRGARPGDTLAIDILDIKIGDHGVMIAYPGFGAIGKRVKEWQTMIVPISGGKVRIFGGLEIPLNVMIGVIGVSPEKDAVPTGTPGPHGGNMDNKLIGSGTRLFLPVFVPGANLALGDLHAAMADGEIGVSGVEAAGEVRVRVGVLSGQTIPGPVLRLVTRS